MIELKKGDIMFCRTNGPISRLIRFLTRGKFSHVALVVSDNEIIEADWFGVFTSPIAKYKYYEIKRCPFLSEHQRNILVHNAMVKQGLGYDYLLFFAMITRIFPFFKKDLTSKYDSPNRWICSEIVDYAYQTVGVDLVPERKDDNVTPEEIYNSKLLYTVCSSL